jgi:hypothetical protein
LNRFSENFNDNYRGNKIDGKQSTTNLSKEDDLKNFQNNKSIEGEKVKYTKHQPGIFGLIKKKKKN